MLAPAAGLPRLRADTYTLVYFLARDPVVQEHEALTKYWGAYMPLELLVHPRAGLALHSPEVLQAAQALAADYPDLLAQFEDRAGTTGRLTVAGS